MQQSICLFCPAFLAVLVLERTSKSSYEAKRFWTIYATFVGILNMSGMAVVVFILHRPIYAVDQALFTASFSVQYLFLTFLLAVLYPICFTIVRNCIHIKLIVEARNENEKSE